MMQPTHQVTPFIWLQSGAETAAQLYVSLFRNARMLDVARWGEGAPYPAGSVMSASFEIDGQTFIAFNGGPHFTLNESFSMFVSCDDQREVDRYWDALTADGGAPSQCGWLKDRFGVSWQIVPKALMKLLNDPVPARSRAAMQAMMGMQKIDIAALEAAADAA